MKLAIPFQLPSSQLFIFTYKLPALHLCSLQSLLQATSSSSYNHHYNLFLNIFLKLENISPLSSLILANLLSCLNPKSNNYSNLKSQFNWAHFLITMEPILSFSLPSHLGAITPRGSFTKRNFIFFLLLDLH